MRSTVLEITASLSLAVALPGVLGAPAGAHQGVAGDVKARMDLMVNFGQAAREIRAAVTARPEMNRQAIADYARVMARSARHIPGLFPPGTDNHPSEARPSIWRDWTGFVKANERLRAAAARLEAVAATADRKAMLVQFASVVRACGACHQAYRKRVR